MQIYLCPQKTAERFKGKLLKACESVLAHLLVSNRQATSVNYAFMLIGRVTFISLVSA